MRQRLPSRPEARAEAGKADTTPPRASGGRPLEPDVRRALEGSLRHNLGDVRVHDDAAADATARRHDARAVAIGRDIAFASGQYDPDLPQGRALLAHEVWHTRQQAAAGRTPASASHESQADAAAAAMLTGTAPPALRPAGCSVQCQSGEVKRAEAKPEVLARRPIRYAQAKASNLAWDKQLGFASLASVGSGHQALAELWLAGRYDAFADAVASLQFDLNLPEQQIDGVLGPTTWRRIAGLGPAMASITEVINPISERLCYEASRERIQRGVRMATGRPFMLPEGATKREFDIILATHEPRMADIEERYRGTGAAGALVYAGLGTFVPEADVWNNGLQPGAAIQVWSSRADYDLLRAGSITLPDGKTRPLRPEDASSGFFGTSFVFVRYEDKDKMVVHHFGRTETHSRSSFEVWIAANPNKP